MKELTLNLYTISRCTHNYYARELRKFGITMGQFPFLMGVAGNDGISQEKLSSGMRISKSTTATVVRQLLEKGLMSRTVDPSDRRNFQLRLTGEGTALIPRIETVIASCHRKITADLSPEERKIFARLTRNVRICAERELERRAATWTRGISESPVCAVNQSDRT